MNRDRARKSNAGLLILFTLLLTLASACSSKQERARKAVEEHLKSMNVREMTVDYFHPADNLPGKAYIAVTVTYNFATGDGSFQKEYLGYVLRQDGPNWTVERNTLYTTDKDRAENALAGHK